MNYTEVDVKLFDSFYMHFTPIENAPLIKEHGLLTPREARSIQGHVSPYEFFSTTKKSYRPTDDKDQYTYFGRNGTSTFKSWFSDQTFIDNNIGYILKIPSLYLKDTSDWYNFKRFRSEKNIPYSELWTIMYVSSWDKILCLSLEVDYIYVHAEKKLYKNDTVI